MTFSTNQPTTSPPSQPPQPSELPVINSPMAEDIQEPPSFKEMLLDMQKTLNQVHEIPNGQTIQREESHS